MTEYTCRAKLYNFVASDPSKPESKKEWKERGLGTLRLNVEMHGDGVETTEGEGKGETDLEGGGAAEPATKPRARLLMRADGSHRVILNTAVKKELRFGDVEGKEPRGQYVYFMGTVDEGGAGKLELLQLKVSLFVLHSSSAACVSCGWLLTCDLTHRSDRNSHSSFTSRSRVYRRLCEEGYLAACET